MRAGDYFGGNLRLYNTLRRVAAAILIVFSLACANQASAAIFGFNPWKEVTKLFIPDVEMERKTFEKSDVERDHGGAKPISDVPTYVPEGYVLIDDQSSDEFKALTWKREINGMTHELGYSRFKMSEDTSITEDGTYESVHNSSVSGYAVSIYTKEDVIWVIWMDEMYRYCIQASVEGVSEKSILKMAQSIYEIIEK